MTRSKADMTAILGKFYLMKFAILEGAGNYLESIGWERPKIEIKPPDDFPDPVIWEALFWASLATTAEIFAAGRTETQAKEAATILSFLSKSIQATCMEPRNAFHTSEAAFYMSLALASHVQAYGPINERTLSLARSGLLKGPAAKAEKSEMWVARLRSFLKEFYRDPNTPRLAYGAVWDAFIEANAGLEAQVRALDRTWPSRATALKQVGVLRKAIIA